MCHTASPHNSGLGVERRWGCKENKIRYRERKCTDFKLFWDIVDTNCDNKRIEEEKNKIKCFPFSVSARKTLENLGMYIGL
jgi:hypothetical protein